MVSRYTSGTRLALAVVLVASLWCCLCTQTARAQNLVLAFSTTSSTSIDGFNNGVPVLPVSSSIPISVGLFNARTSALWPAPSDIQLAVEIFDAVGTRHPQLSLYGTTTATIAFRGSYVSIATGITWAGTMPTIATVHVRDINNMVPAAVITVMFDPALRGGVHVAARIVEDSNMNGIYDAMDMPQSGGPLCLCPLGNLLAARTDGVYRFDLPEYNGSFPIRLTPTDNPLWRVATDGTAGIAIQGYGTYSPVYLVPRLQPEWLWSGVVHRPTPDLTQVRRDSSMLVSSFTETSALTMDMQTSAWRMTSMITPQAGTTATGVLSLAFYGEKNCQPEQKTGELTVMCANGREIVTPMPGVPYGIAVYRNGAIVYVEHNRIGPAVSLTRTVRRWFMRDGVFGVEELQNAPVEIVGGPTVDADSIVFSSAAYNPQQMISRVVCTGKYIDTLEIFDHEIRGSGFYHRAYGTLLPVQTGTSTLKFLCPESKGEVKIALPEKKYRGFTMQWGEPAATGTGAPHIELSAYGSNDVLVRQLGAVVLDKELQKTKIRALPLTGVEGVVQVQAFLNSVEVTGATASGEAGVLCSVWPYRAGVDVQNGVKYAFRWREPVSVQFNNGRVAVCDELRLVYPAAALSARALSDIKVSLMRCIHIPDIEETGDTILPALPLTTKITLTGNVYDDYNGNGAMEILEPGRSGRVVVFRGDPLTAYIDYATTDAYGFYTKDFDPMLQGWAPERVYLTGLSGWQRTSPDYDLIALNQCNLSLSSLDFGERYIGEHNPRERQMYSGQFDNFAVDESEFSNPASTLVDVVEDCGHESVAMYDSLFHNRFFLHTFDELKPDGCVLTQASLTMRLRAGAGDAYNDGIVLEGAGYRFWQADLSKLATGGVWYKGTTDDITLDLGELPPNTGTAAFDALPYIQSGLGLIVDDDTEIDYALLSVSYTACADDGDPSALATGVADIQAGVVGLRVYPNPTVRTGTVSFVLPHRETVTIVLYDALNREVARLLNGVSLPAGNQNLSFVLPSLANGLYTLAVRAGEHSRTQSLWVGR